MWPAFEGDLSEWGKRDLPGFYDEDAGSEASGTTLSSGMGPAGGRPLRATARPFNLEAAREALSYQSGMNSRAQALRRDGQTPAALGVADDLPARMACEQLNILAGMAGQVGCDSCCNAGACVSCCIARCGVLKAPRAALHTQVAGAGPQLAQCGR